MHIPSVRVLDFPHYHPPPIKNKKIKWNSRSCYSQLSSFFFFVWITAMKVVGKLVSAKVTILGLCPLDTCYFFWVVSINSRATSFRDSREVWHPHEDSLLIPSLKFQVSTYWYLKEKQNKNKQPASHHTSVNDSSGHLGHHPSSQLQGSLKEKGSIQRF